MSRMRQDTESCKIPEQYLANKGDTKGNILAIVVVCLKSDHYFPETSSLTTEVAVRIIVVVSLATILLLLLLFLWMRWDSLPLSASLSLPLSLVWHSLLLLLHLSVLFSRRTRASRTASGLGEAAETLGEVEEEVRHRNEDFWLSHPLLILPVEKAWAGQSLTGASGDPNWSSQGIGRCYPPLWSPDNGTGHVPILPYGHQIMVQAMFLSSPMVTR